MKSVGKGTRPHGLKGGAIFRPHGDCSEEFLKSALEPGSRVFLSLLEREGEGREVVLERAIFSKKIIVYFRECPDRNAIEELIPFELEVDVKEEFEDLRGFAVYSQKTGEEVGTIISVGNNGVQNILEVRGKENFDIPWVPDFVERIDKIERKVFVRVPEYI